MARRAGPKRAWQRMLSGRRLDLLDPAPLDIEIEDIAHGLARVARWNGQTKGTHALSVAQHSVLVEDLCGHFRPDLKAGIRLAALLHDAAEYVIGDMISPFKAAIGLDYKAFEDNLTRAIYLRFGLAATVPEGARKLIKRADKAAAFLEATQLAGFGDGEAARFFGRPRGLERDGELRFGQLEPWPVSLAQRRFVTRFEQLQARALSRHSRS